MGVGLSISKRIVEALNGEMTVRRNEDGGATFRFTLPAIEGGGQDER
jgi:two-component system sensor kinase FixL